MVYNRRLLHIFKACSYFAVLLEAVVASEASTQGNITLLRGLYLTRCTAVGTGAVRWSAGYQQAISIIQGICVISGMFQPRSQIVSPFPLLHRKIKDER